MGGIAVAVGATQLNEKEVQAGRWTELQWQWVLLSSVRKEVQADGRGCSGKWQ